MPKAIPEHGDVLARLTVLTPCGVPLASGEACGKPSVDPAPFPICERHMIGAYRHVAALLGAQHVAGPMREQRVSGLGKKAHYSMNGWKSVVYYARIGKHIKIGHTRNLTERINWYPPSAVVLALEPGGQDVERARHAQFADLLDAREEWFHPGPELLRHIEELTVCGLPPAPRAA
jgi:hypothetical protein